MKTYAAVVMCVMLALGCARLRVEGPKEPIKVDVSMRVDIYQHIQKDIDAIEDIVSGSSGEAKSSGQQSMLSFFIDTAYAQEDLDPVVKEAALRRKERLSDLHSFMIEGIVGENKSGLLEIVNLDASDSTVEDTISEENADRMIIYKALAEKNNTSVEEIKKLYSSKLQDSAPSGTPIEVTDESIGVSKWEKK